ncbi:hypothetical protein GCM10010909_27350 [Acidocella aquatica]|uniref:Uncharacterized protein n=1 Tax=Acidocella aquatica TaxID=1922313 RepID=A0ABQ6AD84_9PROT|nr:hypothetical protein [Acidocella aquatica]GLR68054.1 hypothetical protein GCM10010909_27350 [Acidocella aquatica]
MSLSRHVSFYARASALWGAMGVAVLALALAALGFFIAATYIWLCGHFTPAVACLITGGTLLALAAASGLIGSAALRAAQARERARLAQFNVTISTALSLAAYLVRRDPKKAIIFSLLAGVLAEFLSGES